MIDVQSLLADFERTLNNMSEADLRQAANKALRDSRDSYLLDDDEEDETSALSKIEKRFPSSTDFTFSSRMRLGQNASNSYNVFGEGGDAAA